MSGLATVDLSSLTSWQQVILFTEMSLGNPVCSRPGLFQLDQAYGGIGPYIVDNCVRQNVSECVSCIRVRFGDVNSILDTTLRRDSSI